MNEQAQTWKIAVTPLQRYQLAEMASAEGQKLKGQQARVYRRFARSLGIDTLTGAMRKHGGLSGKVLTAPPALFVVTAENLEYLRRLAEEVDRAPAREDIVGPLFDLAEDLLAKRLPNYATPSDVAEFDASSEDFTPSREGDPTVIVESKIEEFVRAAGYADLADRIARGEWENASAT